MSASKPSDPRFKRHKTRHRGITYRVRDGGVRTYAAHLYDQHRTDDAIRAAMA
jgi:hypothetical protein